MGKCSNAFFSETTNTIKAKLSICVYIGWSSTNFTFFVPILPMIIPGQFGFNYPSGFREEAFLNIFPIGSNVKLSPAIPAIWTLWEKCFKTLLL
jgi:hypothetical protein